MDVSLPNAIKDPDNILNKTGRKRLSIVGDGNCLFRCFAFLAYGSENAHAKMRSLLVTFVSLNASSFSALVFEGNIKAHVSKMKRSGEWGTQVELQAAATLFHCMSLPSPLMIKETMTGLSTSPNFQMIYLFLKKLKLIFFRLLILFYNIWRFATQMAAITTVWLMATAKYLCNLLIYPNVTYALKKYCNIKAFVICSNSSHIFVYSL